MRVYYANHIGEKCSVEVPDDATVDDLKREILTVQAQREAPQQENPGENEAVFTPHLVDAQPEELVMFLGLSRLTKDQPLGDLNMTDDSVVHPMWDSDGGVSTRQIHSVLGDVNALVHTGAVADPDWWIEAGGQVSEASQHIGETVKKDLQWACSKLSHLKIQDIIYGPFFGDKERAMQRVEEAGGRGGEV